MTKSFLRFGMLLMVGLSLLATSCNKDSELNETELDAFAEEVIFRTQQSQNMGPFGCYELVFPVTIVFPDRSTVEIDSYDAMKRAIVSWRKENRRVMARPQLQFPYDLINDEGAVITVSDVATQIQVRRECKETFLDQNGPQGNNDRPKACFRIVYPVTIIFPDRTTSEAASVEQLRRLVHAWAQNNPDSTMRPQLKFPIIVQLKEGNTIRVASQEELAALRRRCR